MTVTVTEVSFDTTALTFLLENEEGELMRDIRKRAQRVVTQAKVNASGRPTMRPRSIHWTGVRSNVVGHNPEGRGPNVRTERLRSSIRYWIEQNPEGGKFAAVGTDVPYGYWLETGLKNWRTYPFLTPALSAAGD